MKPGIIVLIVVGSIATITGSILLGLGISKGLTNSEILTHETVLNDEINDLNIQVETSDVTIKVSDSEVSKVICKETEKAYHTVSIINGTLNITSQDDTKWYERMFPNYYPDLKVEVYLAKKEFNDFKFKGATGKFIVESGFTFENLEAKLSTGESAIAGDIHNLLKVETSTGDTMINKVDVKNLELKASTGKITLNEVAVEEKITAKASTGNIIIESTHAADLDAKTSTGNIKMNGLVITNEMKAESDTGSLPTP